MKTYSIFIFSFLTLAAEVLADPADHKPISELKDLRSEEAVFTDASRTKPIVLKSLNDGTKYFDKEALNAISKTVDFEKQIILLFAWKGSGQDSLEYTVKESSPEQIIFSYKAGLTRDLRSHVKVFVIQSNEKWSVQ